MGLKLANYTKTTFTAHPEGRHDVSQSPHDKSRVTDETNITVEISFTDEIRCD